jgi:hypothetical protein
VNATKLVTTPTGLVISVVTKINENARKKWKKISKMEKDLRAGFDVKGR